MKGAQVPELTRDRALRAACIHLALITALTAGCGDQISNPAQPGPPGMAEYLEGLARQNQLTGSVFVSKQGVVLIDQGYGLADEGRGLPNLRGTQFRIGSNTKQFTAMGIWLLQRAGKLRIEDPVCQYLADCPSGWTEVTIQELLDHSSGIPDYTAFDGFPGLIGTPVTEQGLIDRFQNLPLEFTPGSRWSYSNSGYIVLGDLITRFSGQPYADFLRDQIFAPLQMTHTTYDVNNPPVGIHATGYLSPGVEPVYLDMSEFDAAGAIASTVDDLALWDGALLDGTLLDLPQVAEMTRPKIACPAGGCALASDIGYADGWFVAKPAGVPYVYHWGRIDGFRSSNGFYPNQSVIVIVLSNLETTDVWGIASKLGAMALSFPIRD
jgi:CubicO group peptidase (beta-lactamase class C family)